MCCCPQFPAPFSSMLNLMNFFSFDFISIECFSTNAKERYFFTVYVYSIVPLVISFVLFVLAAVRLTIVALHNGSVAAANKIRSLHLYLFLFLTYLVLPPVAMKQLQSLDCIEFEHVEARPNKEDKIYKSKYLRFDTSIDCESQEYYEFRNNILVFIAIYQLIPWVWYRLLKSKKSAVNPAVSKADPGLALHVRSKDVSLSSLRFLFQSYRCEMWWFEVIEARGCLGADVHLLSLVCVFFRGP